MLDEIYFFFGIFRTSLNRVLPATASIYPLTRLVSVNWTSLFLDLFVKIDNSGRLRRLCCEMLAIRAVPTILVPKLFMLPASIGLHESDITTFLIIYVPGGGRGCTCTRSRSSTGMLVLGSHDPRDHPFSCHNTGSATFFLLWTAPTCTSIHPRFTSSSLLVLHAAAVIRCLECIADVIAAPRCVS